MGQPSVGRGPFGPWASDVYGLVADRMRRFTAKQADRTWTARNSQPLAPHGLCFFYLDPAGEARPRLCSGRRMFRDGEHVADAAGLLFGLGELARGYHRGGGLHPPTQLMDVCDPLSPSAFYTAIAISTLDTPAGSWREVRRRATGALTIPVRALVWLLDGTMMLIDRREHHRVNDYLVRCTRLGPSWRNPREWRVAPELAEENDPATYELWWRLWELHCVLAEADRVHN